MKPAPSSFAVEYQTDWQDYELLDSGDGEKLERFGPYTLVRPDPQILWQKNLPQNTWQQADAMFKRTTQDKGVWQARTRLPESWVIAWQDLKIVVKLSPFKHTGVFPEQSAHWQVIKNTIRSARSRQPSYQPHILNLFAYTGLASVVAAQAGAKVTHLDASRAAIGWAKQNQQASGLDEHSIRWILDDAIKFVSREVKRGIKYDGIVLDPPIYGHGPNGERWDFKTSLPVLLELCQQVLVEQPLFVIMNAYAVSTSAVTLGNLLSDMMSQPTTSTLGEVTQGELWLQPTQAGKSISTGIWARWVRNG